MSDNIHNSPPDAASAGRGEGIRELCREKLRSSSSRFAQAFDFVALRVAFALVAFLYLRTQLPGLVWPIALMLLALTVFCMIAHMLAERRLDRYARDELELFRREYLLEQLVLMPKAKFWDFCEKLTCSEDGYGLERRTADGLVLKSKQHRVYIGLLQLHPSVEVGPQVLLELLHRAKESEVDSLVLMSTAEPSVHAKEFCARLKLDITLVGPDRLLMLARNSSLLPGEGELTEQFERTLRAQAEERRGGIRKFRSQLIEKRRAGRYLLSGGIVLLGGLIANQLLYYAAFASVCFTLAALSFFSSSSTPLWGRR